jgi:hypothetical protein
MATVITTRNYPIQAKNSLATNGYKPSKLQPTIAYCVCIDRTQVDSVRDQDALEIFGVLEVGVQEVRINYQSS